METGNNSKHTLELAMNTYGSKLYNTIYSMVRDPVDAEDILQNTFMKALENFEKFRGDSTIYTWLYTIARNEFFRYIRSQDRQKLKKTGLKFEGLDSRIMENPETICMQSERDRFSRRIIEEENGKALTLFLRASDKSIKKVAEELNIPEGTVKSRSFNDRERLRERYGNEYRNY